MTTTTEVRTVSSTGGMKGVKPEAFDLIPPQPLRLLAGFYGTSSVNLSEITCMSTVFNYINEQLWDFWRLSDTDPHSGSLRTVAAAAGCLRLVELMGMSPEQVDNRPHRGSPNELAPTLHRVDWDAGVPILRYDLIPYSPLVELARHYGRGSSKYSAHNWAAGYEWSKPFAALHRHLWAFWNGEDFDEETGSPHPVAATWHCLTLTEFQSEHPAFDDRPVPGTASTRMG